MKKLFALLLASAMILSLVACTNGDTAQDDVDQDVTNETEILDPDNTETPNMNDLDGEQAVAPLPDDDFTENEITPTITPDVEPDVTPDVETPALTPDVTPEPATPAPTTPEVTPETPVTPEVTEPEAPATTDVTAQSLFETLTASGIEFPALSLVEGEFLDMTYAGLADASSDFVVYMPMMSAVAAEIAIAKTDGTSTVSDIFNARIEYQKTSGAFYPAEIEGWTSNSHVVTVGDYVMLLVFPVEAADDTQTLIDLFTATVGA